MRIFIKYSLITGTLFLILASPIYIILFFMFPDQSNILIWGLVGGVLSCGLANGTLAVVIKKIFLP
jgi:hypothetical protein